MNTGMNKRGKGDLVGYTAVRQLFNKKGKKVEHLIKKKEKVKMKRVKKIDFRMILSRNE